MFNDLFTMFDYTWGTGFTLVSVCMWFSGFLLPFFVLSFMVYWYSPSLVESVLMNFIFLFSSKMPGEVKWTGGTQHLFVSLLFLLLMFNMSGVLPYHYPLSSHFFVVGSFGFSFWFATLFMNFSPNWRLLLVGMIQEGGYLLPNIMVVFSEVISMLARPVTLTCRLVMNIIIGQIIINLISNTCLGVFYSFFWTENEFGEMDMTSWGPFLTSFIQGYFAPLMSYLTYLIRHLLIISVVAFMFTVELAVGLLQAFIFTGLLVFYVYEAPLKLKEEMNSSNL
uniref:ATP synthase subunit a n=1 Tax=Callista chinensis TaxID=990943 RepID=A0A889QIA4_9BIVA|nr:ATP synthase F0 subunit 6 [Callista chinensis]QRE83912.1 ATP synthase F0 subunit 6 [Callista chinensis]QWM94244.1 ATP synthase F0 subunit 6 [Callista chinensis]